MTPEQQLHLCRVLWPQFAWYLDGGGVPTRQVVRAIGVWIYAQADLTSDEAVGKMVAYLRDSEPWESLVLHPCIARVFGPLDTGDTKMANATDWREALALLVLEVAGG